MTFEGLDQQVPGPLPPEQRVQVLQLRQRDQPLHRVLGVPGGVFGGLHEVAVRVERLQLRAGQRVLQVRYKVILGTF